MTLQEHYNAIKSGKGNKDQFLKQARYLFPQYINQYSNFDSATNVLKSKQIISEAAGGVVSKGFDIFDWRKILEEEAKASEKQTSKEVTDKQAHAYDNKDMKNADNINFNEIMKGFYCELRDEKNNGKTGDELKDIVVKNLAKDPLYYTKNGMFGTKEVGYTNEAPGLGTNTQPTSKKATVLGGNDEVNSDSDIVKNSLVGSAKKNVQDTLSNSEAKTSNPSKVKEMEITPQNSSGIKKMPMPGKEKKIKLQEEEIKWKRQPLNEDMSKKEYEEKLEDIIAKYVKDPADIDKEISNYYSKGHQGFSDALQANLSRDMDFQTLVQIKHDEETLRREQGLEEGIEEYNNMSDQEIIQWAYDDGFEDYIEYDDNDGLANREEVLKALLGIEDLGSEESKEEMWGPDDIDPAGGRGPSSHMESVAEQKLRSLIQQIIKEELNEFDINQFLNDFDDNNFSNNQASFENKWNPIPKANKEVLDKSTGKDTQLIGAFGQYNYVIAKGSDGKFYRYQYTQASNPGKPTGPFDTIEKAKELNK